MKKKMVEKARKSHWVSLRKNGATKARKRASIANCRGVRLRLLRRRQLNACLPVYRRNKRRPSTEQERTAAFLFPWNWWPLRDEKSWRQVSTSRGSCWLVRLATFDGFRWIVFHWWNEIRLAAPIICSGEFCANPKLLSLLRSIKYLQLFTM